MISGIKAKCRNCDREALADKFKLHYKLRVMVCPDCYSGETQQLKEQAKAQKVESAKPPGWDAEDKYLENFHKNKQKEPETVKFSRIPGTNQVQCECKACKFKFRYDPFRRLPKSCPYCDGDIPRMNTLNLL